MEELDRYVELLGMSAKVNVSADAAWSTTDLSQGQRRRLALIDAITEGKPILVFDECAADQDPEFRAKFYRQIVPELKATGFTLVIVSHDDRYFDVADRIIELEAGQLST